MKRHYCGRQCLFNYKGNGELNLILVYVDDIVLLSADSSHIEEVVSRFKSQYTMQDMGGLEHYLEITIVRDNNVIKLHQTAYAQDVVQTQLYAVGQEVLDKKKTDTPLPPVGVSVKLSKEAEEICSMLSV